MRAVLAEDKKTNQKTIYDLKQQIEENKAAKTLVDEQFRSAVKENLDLKEHKRTFMNIFKVLTENNPQSIPIIDEQVISDEKRWAHCNYATKNSQHLEKHIRDLHYFKCTECYSFFENEGEYTKHMNEHVRPTPLEKYTQCSF